MKGESRGQEATDHRWLGRLDEVADSRGKNWLQHLRARGSPLPYHRPVPPPFRTFPLLPHLSAVVADATPDNVALPTRASGKIDSHKVTVSCRKMTLNIS